MYAPIIKRIAPELPRLAEIIRGNSGDLFRIAFSVDFKKFWITPCIRAVGGDKYRDVADYLYVIFIGGTFYFMPLLAEFLSFLVHFSRAAFFLTAMSSGHEFQLAP